MNFVEVGDCKEKLKTLKEASVDLIYLDPPFFTQKKHSLSTKNGDKIYSFNDSWDSIDDYVDYMTKRLLECKRVLKDTGSIFLHCDRQASHHLRVILDKVFDIDNFQSEIIWHYKRWSNAKKGLLNSHQTIFFYSKTKNFKFNPSFEEYSPTTNIDQIFQKRVKDKNGKSKYKIREEGKSDIMEQKNGVPLSDVWEIPYLNPKAKERVDYPTQKPIILLEKIINLVTDKGDVVLDPFCGSGTTLVAAKLLERRYIGFDIAKDAISLSEKRLLHPIKSESELLKRGKDSYKNQDAEVCELLKKIEAVPVQRNKGIDGFLKINETIKPIPIKIQRETETLDTARMLLNKSSKKNGFIYKILFKTHNHKDNFLFGDIGKYDDGILLISDIDDFIQNREKLLKRIAV